MKVFILDDSPEFIFLVESLFKLKGMDLHSEGEVNQALERLNSEVYDLLIIDYLLEGTNGLEIIKSLRQMDQYRGKPIILLTAKKLDESELQLVKEYGVLFLAKPIQPTEFYNKVRGFIEG